MRGLCLVNPWARSGATLASVQDKHYYRERLLQREFWTKLINFDHLVDTGMISPEDLDLFRFVETADEAWETLQQVYGLGQHTNPESASGW